MSNFFCKGPAAVFGFASHVNCAATVQLGSFGAKATIDNKYVNKWVWPFSIKLYLKIKGASGP